MLPVIPHLMRNPGNIGKGNTHKRRFSGPRIAVRGDRHVIPHLMRCFPSYRALTRYPEISAKAILTRGTFLDPASWCGVTRCLTRYPGIPAKAIPTRGTFLGPASWCGVTRCLTRYPGIPADAPLNGTAPIDTHRLRLEYIRELHQSPPTSPSTAGFPVR